MYSLLHKDELVGRAGKLIIRATALAPPGLFQLVVRELQGSSLELEVTPDTSVRECRLQLESRGGPWGDSPRWLYGGTLIQSGRNVAFYGIKHRDIIDVVPSKCRRHRRSAQ